MKGRAAADCGLLLLVTTDPCCQISVLYILALQNTQVANYLSGDRSNIKTRKPKEAVKKRAFRPFCQTAVFCKLLRLFGSLFFAAQRFDQRSQQSGQFGAHQCHIRIEAFIFVHGRHILILFEDIQRRNTFDDQIVT